MDCTWRNSQTHFPIELGDMLHVVSIMHVDITESSVSLSGFPILLDVPEGTRIDWPCRIHAYLCDKYKENFEGIDKY